MKLSMTLNYSGDPKQAAATAADYERAGVDAIWVAELYSFDAVSILGYLAAKTERMELVSGILPIYSRTPALIASTAAGLDAVSDGRFVLGLGASGPQVIEGWHGVKYDKPLTRTRELIDICRIVWKRERLTYEGDAYTLPPAAGFVTIGSQMPPTRAPASASRSSSSTTRSAKRSRSGSPASATRTWR